MNVGSRSRWGLFPGVAILLAALAANAAVLLDSPHLNSVGAALLLYVLPGLALMCWVAAHSPIDAAEWLTVGVGSGLALTVLVGLGVHYLPGPLERGSVLLGTDLLIVAFVIAAWAAERRAFLAQPDPASGPLAGQCGSAVPQEKRTPKFASTVILVALVGLAAFYRFTFLGYSEFQGDESLVTWATARAITGEDDILFQHGKSPAEVVLPAAYWVLDGRLNEATARFPFALAGLTAVLGGFLLGRSFWGERVGLIAAFLFGINGYFIGFSRVVQYQSLVVLMGVLAVFTAYRARRDQHRAYQVLSGLFLGVGLLAHYDGLLVAPVVAYLWLGSWWTVRVQGRAGAGSRWTISAALALALLTVAAFYLPLIGDAQFREMLSYLGGARVGGNLLNNHVPFLLLSGTVYNSVYYTALLVVLGFAALWSAWRWLPAAAAVSGILSVLMVLTAVRPGLWQFGEVNLAAAPFFAAMVLAWFSPTTDVADRVVWLWLGVTVVSYLFVLALPLSHIYVIMPAWLLVAASELSGMVGKTNWFLMKTKGWETAVPALLVVVLLAYYPYLVFVRHLPEFVNDPAHRASSIYWRPWTEVPAVGLFGFPHRSGWKAIGRLYEIGALNGDYRSNEEEWVSLWYTRWAPRSCRDDARYYFIADRPWDPVAVPEELLSSRYDLVGRIAVQGRPRLHIWERAPARGLDVSEVEPLAEQATEVAVVEVTALEAEFDAASTPERFVQKKEPQRELGVAFGGGIVLLGYDIDSGVTYAGGRLNLTLYWQARQSLAESYHVFVHLRDGAFVGQSDTVPVCGRLPSSAWRLGQVVVDRHSVDISGEAPPGRYGVYVGLYLPDTGERLEPDGRNDGTNAVLLAEVDVVRDQPVE